MSSLTFKLTNIQSKEPTKTRMSRPVIMCVDDEPIVLTSLNIQLKQEFRNIYSLEMAESASEAMEILEELQEEEAQVLVIISYWLMPGKKGDDFLIDVHKIFPNAIKIMLTGQADREAVAKAKKQANLYACLTKPWTKEYLINTIKTAISKFTE
jgi:response regulator RpfG family c-di-GMP phosphodiesterase